VIKKSIKKGCFIQDAEKSVLQWRMINTESCYKIKVITDISVYLWHYFSFIFCITAHHKNSRWN